MRVSQKWWRIRRQVSQWMKTLQRDGLLIVFQVASGRINDWYHNVRRRLLRGHSERSVFPFIEPSLAGDAENPRVSLIIPIYNGLVYVEQCIAALYAHPVRAAFEVVAIDQASTDGSREYLQDVANAQPNFHLIENLVNVGFPRAVNQGAARARGEILMIVNSDVILAPGCIDLLLAALDADSQLAVVSPMTNYVGRGPQVDPAAETLQPHQIVAYAARISDRSNIQPVIDHLVFFCVMLRRKVFEFLGGMSEVYGLGNYEDNDFCLRARLMGFSLAIVPNAFAFHFGSRTFKDQQLAHARWMQRNERIYYERAARLATSWPLLKSCSRSASAPRLTVAIDASTDPSALIPTLISIAHQTVDCFEVVVVGNASLIEDIVARFADVFPISFENLPSGNSAIAWNQVIAVARGAWLIYLRAGDVLYPTHVETLLSLGNSETPVICTGLNEVLCWYDNSQAVVLARAPYFRETPDLSMLWTEPAFSAPAFAHSIMCLREVGEFDPELEPLADWDFLLRLNARYSIRWTDTISAERRLCLGPLPKFGETLLQLAEAKKQAFQQVSVRHPISDESLRRLRRQSLVDLDRKVADLEWLAAQEWDAFSRAREMASVWLGVEV